MPNTNEPTPIGRNSKLIIPDGDGIMLLSDLAVAFGDREALVIQQVYYLTHHTKMGKFSEGRRWVANTYKQWQHHNFPFWTERKVKTLFAKLVKLGALEVRQLHGRVSRVNSYAVNEEMVKALQGKESQPFRRWSEAV